MRPVSGYVFVFGGPGFKRSGYPQILTQFAYDFIFSNMENGIDGRRESKERGNAMQEKRAGYGLFLILLAWIVFEAGMSFRVYGAEARHWNVGDTVVREIEGTPYRFRCIDQNYADHMDFHRNGALFLCDEVIPANTGSRYAFETPGDKPHDYVYYPGPIVSFGDSADYKKSSIRRWLSRSAKNFADAVMVNTGVERGYTGSTDAESWEMFSEGGLAAQYLGSQKMEDQLFILSVDEAYRYRNWLWKFGPARKRNPESQISEFCKGYWLRTPCGRAEGGQIYIVDLVRGNIRPEAVRVGETEETDEELKVTGTTGVRPVFVLPQKN